MIASNSRGKLLTYLGIAPGVGKTYQMLRDGRADQRLGKDVIVAYLERHGRAATVAQIGDLEVLGTRKINYRGTDFEDLDLEAVLERRPDLALVDELAHANVPGSRHERRWQDVDELLDNGIDVFTTLNVANIESLRKSVSEITNVRPSEPVPDDFLRTGEVKLVDLEPSALRRRLAQGDVFAKEQADAALSHYFRFANLSALKELTELWLDDSVDDPVARFLQSHDIKDASRCVAVAVGLDGSEADEWLIRYASSIAEVSNASVQGIHVQPDDNFDRVPQERVELDRWLLEQMHGTLVEVKAEDTATGLVQAARRAGASQLVIGRRHHSPLSRRLGRSTVARVLAIAEDLSVQVVNVGQAGRPGDGSP